MGPDSSTLIVEGEKEFSKKPCLIRSWGIFSDFQERYLVFGGGTSWKRYFSEIKYYIDGVKCGYQSQWLKIILGHVWLYFDLKYFSCVHVCKSCQVGWYFTILLYCKYVLFLKALLINMILFFPCFWCCWNIFCVSEAPRNVYPLHKIRVKHIHVNANFYEKLGDFFKKTCLNPVVRHLLVIQGWQ